MSIPLCFLFIQSNFFKAFHSKQACDRVDTAILNKLDFVTILSMNLYMNIYKIDTG